MTMVKTALLCTVITLGAASLTACGGGSGGPGFGSGGGSGGGSNGAGGGSGGPGGNGGGVIIGEDGGVILSAQALRLLNLQLKALTSQELLALNLTVADIGVNARAITKQGQIVAIRLPGGQTFAVPGGPGILPGTGIRLPSLPSGGLGGSGLGGGAGGVVHGVTGTVGGVVGGIVH